MRPPLSRPGIRTRENSAAPSLHAPLRTRSGAISPAESTTSSRQRSPAGIKRKERDYEADAGEETNINVVVRCRGRNEREIRENSGLVVDTKGARSKSLDLIMGPSATSNKTYHFDKVFGQAADQIMLYEDVVAPILDEVGTYGQYDLLADGYNRWSLDSIARYSRTDRPVLERPTRCLEI